jgi:hypothetical protein
MNQDISESSHPFEFLQECLGDHPLFGQDLEYFTICIRFSIITIRDNVTAYVQDAFDGKVEIPFGCGMYEHIFLEYLDIIPLNRLEGLQIVMQFFDSDGDEVFADHELYLS